MDNRSIVIVVGVVGIVAFTIGYRNGVRSMVRDWQRDVSPAISDYLAARDALNEILHNEEDSEE